MNNVRLITQILYRLKREYGTKVTLRKASSPTVAYDPKTGTSTSLYTDYVIKRTIVGPVDILRSRVYDLSYVAAGKNFTEGAFFDQGDLAFIFDLVELRRAGVPDLEILRTDSLVYDSERYEITDLKAVQSKAGWIIKGRKLANPGAEV